eukprot:g19267.t3
MRLPSLHQQLSSIPVLSTGTKCPGDFTAVDSILHWLSHGVRMPACIFHQGQACAFIGKDGRLSDNRRQAEFSTGESSSEEFRQVSCRFMSGKARIPDSVTSIEASAFQNCRRLVELQLPGSLRRIRPSAFCGCSGCFEGWGDGEVSIPRAVTSIQSGAFEACSGLRKVQIPEQNDLQTFEIPPRCRLYTMRRDTSDPEESATLHEASSQDWQLSEGPDLTPVMVAHTDRCLVVLDSKMELHVRQDDGSVQDECLPEEVVVSALVEVSLPRPLSGHRVAMVACSSAVGVGWKGGPGAPHISSQV